MHYQNFDLSIEPRASVPSQYRVHVESPEGEADGIFVNPFSPIEQTDVIRANWSISTRHFSLVGTEDSKPLSPPLDAKIFGTRLFEAVFQDKKVSKCLNNNLLLAKKSNQGLRIRLRLNDVPDLARLLWEYLRDPEQDYFFALSVKTPVVRYLELNQNASPLQVPYLCASSS